MQALLETANMLAPFVTYGELDHFARVWWSRRRHVSWGQAFPVGGEVDRRIGRTGQRARSVQLDTVRLAVESYAHRLDPEHEIPGALYMNESAPRKARQAMRALL